MKNVRFFALTLLISFAAVSPRALCADTLENVAPIETVDTTTVATEGQSAFGKIVLFPFKLLGGMVNYAYNGGARVVNMGSSAFTSVGSVANDYVLQPARDHKAITGVVTVALVVALFSRTEIGKKFFASLCPCKKKKDNKSVHEQCATNW